MKTFEYDENAKQYTVQVVDPDTDEVIGETNFGLGDPKDLLAMQVEKIIDEYQQNRG